MKRLVLLSIMLAFFGCSVNNEDANKDFTQYVNVFIGTGSIDSLSLSGSNFPGACVPFGLVQLSPDTDDNPEDPCSGYDYADSTIVGFSHTHLSGTGVADLFDFLFMPYGGNIKWDAGSDDRTVKGYRSAFKHENEKAFPGYYSVILDDYNIKAELTATEHCGMHRYTFNKSGKKHLIIDLDHSLDKARPYWSCRIIGAQIKIVNDHTIEGYRIITGWARERRVYFHAEFSEPITAWKLRDGRRTYENSSIVNGTDIKAVISFNEELNKPVEIKVGLSSVSLSGARKNFDKEIRHLDFEEVVKFARDKWNNILKSISVDADERTKVILYTGLYHLFIQPNNIADIDGKYIDHNGVERIAGDGRHFSTFSLWDTFRAAHPLYTLLTPKYVSGFINSMLRQYKYYGYLPIWQLWGSETYCMIGNHAIPVIVDAFKKGIPGIDYKLAYKAVLASSKTTHRNSRFDLLDKYGYFPENLQSQSVSLGLEIAYNDWCTAQFANEMGDAKNYEYFTERSKLYKNLFDRSIGFFRAKDDKGNWIEPFSPLVYGGNGGYPFTEGNGWQYLWYVPHDIEGLIQLLGGKDAFTKKLNEFFTLTAKPEDVNGNASGFIGQYAHGNEPSHHIAYLYNFSNESWKAQFYVNKICKEFYNETPSGYSGNEDCGQMSAWYIFSSLGFYPVNPADGKYYFGSPQFERAEIPVGNGNSFEIITHNISDENIYIDKILLNGEEYHKNYIEHKQIMRGGKLEYYMSSTPNKKCFK